LHFCKTAPAKLPRRVREVIADPEDVVHLSTVNLREISLKLAPGKLELTDSTPDELVPLALGLKSSW